MTTVTSRRSRTVPRVFRRQGLPCREIVSRQGDVFVHVGNMDGILRAVQAVLRVRKEYLHSSQYGPYHGSVKYLQWVVLKRESQIAAFARCQENFVEHHAEPVLRKYENDIRASTPDFQFSDLSEAAQARVARGYFKNHCFVKFGGQRWLKFLIALGGVPEVAVDATNEIIAERVLADERRVTGTAHVTSTRPAWAYQRQERANRPCPDAGHARQKELRDSAKAAERVLKEDMWNAGRKITKQQQDDFKRREANIQERSESGGSGHLACSPCRLLLSPPLRQIDSWQVLWQVGRL